MNFHASGHFVVIDQTALTRSDAAFFHLLTEPLVVVHGAGKEVESSL